MRHGCPFCDYEGPSEVLWEADGVFVIEPMNPVVDGHKLVIPRRHVEDFRQDARLFGHVAACAADLSWAYGHNSAWNLITSAGEDATQTIRHLHIHLVPRVLGDGLALPWSSSPAVPVAVSPEGGKE